MPRCGGGSVVVDPQLYCYMMACPHPHCLTVCIFEAVLCLLCSFWVCSALQYTYTVLIVQCQICAECAVYIVQSAVQDGQTETLATEPANQDDSGNDDQADDNEHHDC